MAHIIELEGITPTLRRRYLSGSSPGSVSASLSGSVSA
jgi:hypothetical protein